MTAVALIRFGSVREDGLLTPIDIDRRPSPKRDYRPVPAHRGLVVEDRASGVVGAVVDYSPPRLVVRDRHGRDHAIHCVDGAVMIDGEPVALRRPRPGTRDRQTTASGSVDPGPVPARVARASRIWVEGIHDAELVEKIWGDDLRAEGVVVERLDGVDDLIADLRRFGPRSGRRLGILLDHLVPGSKESRLAATVDHPDVLITGHPYVDVWQAVKPQAIGIDSWPEIPAGRPWKEGVVDALGLDLTAGQFWRRLLAGVSSWKDLEAPLLSAVEQLIDFVAPPDG